MIKQRLIKRPVKQGSLLCLLSWRRKKVGRPPVRKPANILFGQDGAIQVGDFGVANLHAGTALYLAPEMLLGEAVSVAQLAGAGLVVAGVLVVTGRVAWRWPGARPAERRNAAGLSED